MCQAAASYSTPPLAMADKKVNKEVISVVVLCILWYVVSSSNNVIGKWVLSDFPFPMTVTMVQLTSITVYSGPFFNLWGVRKYVDISWRYYFRFIVPLALGKFLASVTSHISIWKVPVSYAHTGKRSRLVAQYSQREIITLRTHYYTYIQSHSCVAIFGNILLHY